MIQIKTSLPQQETLTLERRTQVAQHLSKFFPDHFVNFNNIPYQVGKGEDAPFVLDIGNDWRCWMEDDTQTVTISYRYANDYPGKEWAFANWVCEKRTGWKVVQPKLRAADPTEGTAAVVSVMMDVQFPYKVDEWELGTVTFAIPIEAVQVFLDSKVVPGATVTGYTTTDDIEVTTP